MNAHLLESIENLKNSEVKNLVNTRIREFKENGAKSNGEIFIELCFCILTANFNAEKAIKIQTEIGKDFLTLPESQLAEKLKRLGHRYPNTRAKYIVKARKYKDSLKEVISSFNVEDELREWLVKNIKGIGYKEASHFLRNIGYTNFAIIDFHITDLLARYKLLEKPKTLTKKEYFKIENLLREIAEKSNLNLAELDLYLWYMETGKILK
ncbi:N-glycosylase/DNA lyase [Candidatus Bathyarchaeota archaeon]|nr:MAG: N-glycosylase/DNA lyase [Candidatus Bathyarchaeota archaeon]